MIRVPTSSSCGGLWPRVFLPFGQKTAYYAVLAHFWCPVVTLVVFSSNLSNFERNPKEPNKSPKNPKKKKKLPEKNLKTLKNLKKIVFFKKI